MQTYKGRVIQVHQEEVVLPNGNKVLLDLATHPGASAVVPVLDDGRFIMLRQYRHAAGGYLYEIPAGKLDKKDEDPAECAKRELLEEAGYRAGKIEKLISIHTTPGFCNEMIHIYLATKLTKDKTNHEVDEIIEVEFFTRAELEKMLDNGQISDAKTLVGLLTAFRRL
jgi:ADP-ribose pyrophosphatase